MTCFSCFNLYPCQKGAETTFWDFWAQDLRDRQLLLSPSWSQAPRVKSNFTKNNTWWNSHAREGERSVEENRGPRPMLQSASRWTPNTQTTPGETIRKTTQSTHIMGYNQLLLSLLVLGTFVVQSLARLWKWRNFCNNRYVRPKTKPVISVRFHGQQSERQASKNPTVK